MQVIADDSRCGKSQAAAEAVFIPASFPAAMNQLRHPTKNKLKAKINVRDCLVGT